MTTTLISIGAFLLMLVILVLVHELGHFLTAIWMGIKVEEFGIGYPPRALVMFERNGVKYTLNWLPLGGFVRFASNDESQDSLYGAGGSLAAATPWRKILVMVAGPLMNLVLAMVVFGVIFALQGVPRPAPGQEIGAVFEGTPAAVAGIEVGDVLLSLNGVTITSSDLIGQAARQSGGKPIPAVVLRNGQELALTVTPGPWTGPDGTRYDLGFGFSYSPHVVIEQVNPLTALWMGTTYSIDLTGQMLRSLASLPAAIGGIFSPTPSPAGEPIGPIGIARATGEVIQQPGGFLAFWNLTAILSLNLFLLNLLPIPALDGSHIIFATIEWLRGGKKVPPEKEALVHAFGFVALMGLMLVITVNDVINALQGTPILGN
ncbi:peptidase M50 [Oscillochloris trichoides DG-6]|uniref:Peptidase M50 n=1 Tax=Oscillochloris trichoides DG-6 TaxID=765420 RepID=E1IE15_9CHLR|nr:M50 family metallopeptidase [Oscillochloris trichoides]EFO80557.1 peptidase M50 [Oscillochloris trichoides DG-6]